MATFKIRVLFFCAILSIFVKIVTARRKQCLTVRGTVTCSPGSNLAAQKTIFVQLFDEDRFSRDDLMDEGYASRSGAFYLGGCADDGAFNDKIDPVIKIFHKCKQKTSKLVAFQIPKNFIGSHYNISQTVDLSGSFAIEEEVRSPVPKCPIVQ